MFRIFLSSLGYVLAFVVVVAGAFALPYAGLVALFGDNWGIVAYCVWCILFYAAGMTIIRVRGL